MSSLEGGEGERGREEGGWVAGGGRTGWTDDRSSILCETRVHIQCHSSMLDCMNYSMDTWIL